MWLVSRKCWGWASLSMLLGLLRSVSLGSKTMGCFIRVLTILSMCMGIMHKLKGKMDYLHMLTMGYCSYYCPILHSAYTP